MELTDTRIHGRYIGLLLGPAATGASFEAARVEMTINDTGITLPFGEGVGDERLSVHYPPEMVFHLLGWGMDKDLAIRQHPDSDLAQVIIGQVPWYKKIGALLTAGVIADMTVILGEGMPLPLMLFMKEKRGEAMLRRVYQKLAADHDKNESDEGEMSDWLVRVEQSEIDRVLRSDSVEEKRKVIESLGHNLWTAPPDMIAERITIFEQFLNDPNPMVRYYVMEAFTLGVRVVEAVPLIERQFEWLNFQDLSEPSVGIYATKVADAAQCLLYEAYNHLKPQVLIKQRFGSLDRKSVLCQLGNVIAARDENVFTDFIRGHERSPSRDWTTEHYLALRRVALKLSVNRYVFIADGSMQDLCTFASLADDVVILRSNYVH